MLSKLRHSLTVGSRARELALELKRKGVKYIYPSLLCKHLGITDAKGKNSIGQAVLRLQRKGELDLLPKEIVKKLMEEGSKLGRTKRNSLPEELKDVPKRFLGTNPRKVCEHIIQNLSEYNETPPEDVSSLVFSRLRESIPDLKMNTVSCTVGRLRKIKILSDIPPETRAKLLVIRGRKGAEVVWGLNPFVDVIRGHIKEKITQGVSGETISGMGIYRELRRIPGLTLVNVAKTIEIMRRRGELPPLSKEAISEIYAQGRKKGYETLKEKALLPEFQHFQHIKKIKIRAFVESALKLGYSPEEISVENVFNELKYKVRGITEHDVRSTLYGLRKDGLLPPLSKEEGTQLRTIIKRSRIKRSRRPIKEVEREPVLSKKAQSILNQQAKVLVNALRKYEPRLKKSVKNTELFFKILEQLINSNKIQEIPQKILDAGFVVDDVDVAVVCLKAAEIVEWAREKESSQEFEQFRSLLSKTRFWNNSSLCREIIKKWAFRVTIRNVRMVETLIKGRLLRLGLIQKK